MSQYTTEFRYIFDNWSDATIFGEYPIFDENYRQTLNSKIKDYYMFQEIGFDPVGKFCQRMRSKMSRIMPYYNQLYESQLAEINPFITKRYGYTLSSLANKVLDEKNKSDRNVVDILNDILSSNNKNINSEILSSASDSKGNDTNYGGASTVDTSKEKMVGDKSDVFELSKENSNERFNDVTNELRYNDEKDTLSYQNENKNTTYNNVTDKNTETGSIKHDDNIIQTKNTKSVTSDAPEGLVQLSTLESNLYANQATIATEKMTPSGSSTDTFNNHVNENVKSGGIDERYSGGHENTKSGGHTDTKKGDIENTKDYERLFRDSVNTVNEKENASNTFENSNNVTSQSDITTTDKTGVVDDTKYQTNDKTSNINELINGIRNEIESNDSNSDYSTIGFDSTTMSEMLLKWRNTFINIDQMIIDELEDMFMILLI